MKTFRDHVHVYIKLPSLCIRIIDTPEFQRLRRLKQLGVCCFVYPNATHTRFEHSLGVAHLAGRLMQNLQGSQPELGITQGDIDKVQVAGLVHDLGHGPWSHTYERAKPGFSHETHGIKIWMNLCLRLGISDDVRDFVEGCLWVEKRIPNQKQWMYNLIHHPLGALDVDRLDYCKRDARVTSVSIDFDLDRILSHWRIKDGQNMFPQKLADDILALHHARYMLFETVYNHPVVARVDQIMVQILRDTQVDPSRDGDDVIYYGADKELLAVIETRSFTHDPNPKPITVVSHYGAGENNPLDLVLFEPPLTQEWKDAMLPRKFSYKKELK